MDLFDLFEKYRNNTLTEKDILMCEYQGYLDNWFQPTKKIFIKNHVQRPNNSRSKKARNK
jgi:hypothetical protein